ncbi:MAG: hypothetical protein AAB791_01075, partial [Patescibacteria group bacterium]
METNNYSLPPLPYDYQDLEPYISKEQLTLHHQKHHAVYVKGANALLEKLNESRKEGSEPDMKAILKELSFHVGGCVLHSLFWENMAPGKGGEPSGKAMEVIKKEFSDFGRFKKEFSFGFQEIDILLEDKTIAGFFEKTASEIVGWDESLGHKLSKEELNKLYKILFNYLTTDVFG